ncbi:FmdB family zinc ribbon protein [Legionella spiritensis]|uniref:Zinc ribbon domain protein n=1 Tax=Legionella spiritensis TaxID=452 RepID=A0A0W0Z4J5_LEGSP|nr:zinc ribbon domain-containing protein [Legionella spiritensis]KTD64073.1 Zinc ribbon domain protein [Legionella spiritensis]SNV37599.1 Type I antifreeze protein [Legionella spiritensis]VEG90108.1 Type I antifreeze protein [Legionella spiritensis]
MPIYEYQCTNCHHHFDLMQKISEPPAKQCPKCFEETAIRLVSAAGFQLKGSGWYATDFKNKGKPVDATEKKSGSGEKKSTGDNASGSQTSSSKGEND